MESFSGRQWLFHAALVRVEIPFPCSSRLNQARKLPNQGLVDYALRPGAERLYGNISVRDSEKQGVFHVLEVIPMSFKYLSCSIAKFKLPLYCLLFGTHEHLFVSDDRCSRRLVD